MEGEGEGEGERAALPQVILMGDLTTKLFLRLDKPVGFICFLLLTSLNALRLLLKLLSLMLFALQLLLMQFRLHFLLSLAHNSDRCEKGWGRGSGPTFS